MEDIAINLESIAEECTSAALYSSLQVPVDGVTQLLDEGFGTNLHPHAQFFQRPENAEFGSIRWHSQAIGHGVGSLLPYLVLSRSFHGLAGRGLVSNMRHQCVVGAVYGGVLTPTDVREESLLTGRMRSAVTSGAVFSSMAFSSYTLGTYSQTLRSTCPNASRLLSGRFAGAISGIPAGAVSADLESLIAGHGLASSEDRMRAAYSFSLIGLSMAPFHSSSSSSSSSSMNVRARDANSMAARVVATPNSTARQQVSPLVEPNQQVSRFRETITEIEPTTPSAEVRITEPINPAQLTPNSATLNVVLGSRETVAGMMSNLAHTPFVFEGRIYASVEAFYQGLKWSDPLRRIEISTLYGHEAKYAGRGSNASVVSYNGRTIELGGFEHHSLISRVIRAKLEQHADLAREFAETYPREIIHDLGYPGSRNTRLPARDFCRILTELRQELVNSQAERLDHQALPGSLAYGRTVSESIALITDSTVASNHNLGEYVRAFASFDRRVRRYLGSGVDSVAFELTDGNVLKISHRSLAPSMGNRPFDLPILERGAITQDGFTVNYHVQPLAEAATPSQFFEFFGTVRSAGYHFRDPRPTQLGLHNGEVRLLDYWAVEPTRARLLSFGPSEF